MSVVRSSCSLFVVVFDCCVLFVACAVRRCLLFVVPCGLCVVCCVLWCSLFVACCLLFVVCKLLLLVVC